MMGKIWLVTCNSGELAWMRGEVLVRDPGARFLRCTKGSALPQMAGLLQEASVGAALDAEAVGDEELEAVIAELAGGKAAGETLVFTAHIDPGQIARWFHAGATEVIAAGDAALSEISESISMTCMGSGPREIRACGVPAVDDGTLSGLEAMPTPWEMPNRSAEAGSYDELDEPPSTAGERPHPSQGPAIRQRAKVEEQAAESAPSAASEGGAPAGTASAAAETARTRRAPLVTVVAGRGGCGKTTLVAAMAACAARMGLRAAVLDLDLMFGNLSELMGVDSFKGFEGVGAHATEAGLEDADVEGSAMRIGPGLTLWGPCEEPERAELMASSAERLVETLRDVADVIFADTSVQWGDAVAMAVESCERCVVVGSSGGSAAASTKRVIALAAKLGVPATRMTFVFNRFGARGCGEDQALGIEMSVSLSSHARVADGGDEVAGLASFEQVDALVTGTSAFAKDVAALTGDMLKELGCPVAPQLLEGGRLRSKDSDRFPLRLPWQKKPGDVR